jgi:hypothetical protein
MDHRICPKCGALLTEDIPTCAVCNTGITDWPAFDEKEQAPEADDDLVGLLQSKPPTQIENAFQTKGVHYGIIFGVVVGLLGLVAGVLGSDGEIAACGLSCCTFSAIFGFLFFGASTFVFGTILNSVTNRFYPKRRAFIQRMEEVADRDDEDDHLHSSIKTLDVRPPPLAENNSSDIKPQKDPEP